LSITSLVSEGPNLWLPLLRCARIASMRSVVRPSCRRRQEALEVGEVLDGADLADARRHVAGNRGEPAARRFVTFLLEQLVGDPHLDVVGLAGEEQQRLVLRLPPEPGMVPSLPLRLTRPLMPRLFSVKELEARLARMVLSLTCSIRPAPN
jgi:hypothetical protein